MEQALKPPNPEADAKVIKLSRRNGAMPYYVGNDQRKRGRCYRHALCPCDKGIFLPWFLRQLYRYRSQALKGLDRTAESVYIVPAKVSLKAKSRTKAEKCTASKRKYHRRSLGRQKWDATAEYAMAFLKNKARRYTITLRML